MHSVLVLTSLLSLLTSANPLPLESRQSTLNPFTLIAGRSGSPIHLSAINANGESFWIGKSTASYCPTEVVTDCPAGLYTELLAGEGGASMVKFPADFFLVNAICWPFLLLLPQSTWIPPENV